jgi:outer membrane receptor for ferrienterochelin and colicins
VTGRAVRQVRRLSRIGLVLGIHGLVLGRTSSGGAEESKPPLNLEEVKDLSLEQLLQVDVTAAAKTSQQIEAAPAVVTVITARDLRQAGYRTVGDALRHVVGLHVVHDHTSYDVGVRGIHGPPGAANETIKVMINGHPIAFRSTGESRLGHDLIPIEAIRQIEVIRTPASALYGANAFLGVINVVTYTRGDKDSPMDRHVVSVDGGLVLNPHGTPLTGTVSFVSGMDIGKFHYFVSGTFHRDDRSGLVVPGYENMARSLVSRRAGGTATDDAQLGYPSPGWNLQRRRYLFDNGITKDDTGSTGSFYGIASYDLAKELVVDLDLHVQYQNQASEFAYFSPLTHDTRTSTVNGYSRLVLAYGRERTEGPSFQLSVAAALGTPTDADRVVDPSLPGFFKRRRYGYNAYDFAAEASHAFGSTDGKPSSKITIGADLSSQDESLMEWDVVNEATGATTRENGYGKQRFTNLGAFAQWLWNPVKPLHTSLGSRIDHNSQIACNLDRWGCFGALDDTVAPSPGPREARTVIDNRGLLQLSNRVAVVYSFPWAGFYGKAIYSSSFKPPSPFQLYHRPLTAEGSTVGDPTLKPQTADTIEVQIGARPSSDFHASVTNFYSYVSNTVRYFKEGDVLRGRNANIELAGLELEARYALKRASTSFFANGSVLYYQRLEPLRLRTETDTQWQYSQFNTVTGTDRYPNFMVKAGVNVAPPKSHLNVNLLGMVVGPRPASLSNGQLYNWNSLNSNYELDPYVTFDITVSTVDLHLLPGKRFEDKESVLSFSVKGIGTYADPGFGGVDTPSSGPRVLLKLEQAL